jgi:hypothetical protein
MAKSMIWSPSLVLVFVIIFFYFLQSKTMIFFY